MEYQSNPYHIDWHVKLGESEVTIPQHGVVGEMHLHAIKQRANDVVAKQCSKLRAIPALYNIEQCGTEKGYPY